MNIIEEIAQENSQRLADLKSVIGQVVSQNFSPTLSARLVKVTPKGCTFESVQSEYRNYPADKVGVIFTEAVETSWNCFFY